jgi:hypothetical protein
VLAKQNAEAKRQPIEGPKYYVKRDILKFEEFEKEVAKVVNLACECNAIAWSIGERIPRAGIRYVCHCDDCQAFAHFIGRPNRVLDANGGTDAYQLPASRLMFSRGLDNLSCVRMTNRRLIRWYCSHCNTPVANTYDTSKLSFLSVPLCALPAEQRDEALGPSSGHVWTKFGHGDLSRAKQVSIPAMLLRMASRIAAARMSGDYLNNPFFDPITCKPICMPRHLTFAERSELDLKVHAVTSA